MLARRDEDEFALAPQPGVGRIDELASALTATGLPVEITVEIVDDGAGATTVAGSGFGLDGMREHVEAYGGELESRRRPGGGYALRARLPLGSSR